MNDFADLWPEIGGPREARIAVSHPDKPTFIWTISTPFAVLGRSRSCQLVLDSEAVSRRHAVCLWLNGQLWCIDLHSRTGIFRGSEQTTASPFSVQSFISIGPYLLHLLPNLDGSVAIQENASSPLKAFSTDAEGAPGATLKFPSFHENVLWRVDRPVTLIGKAPICKVRFHCAGVSDVHCALLQTKNNYWIIDLGSRHGVFRNGCPVTYSRLENGDSLVLGEGRLEVCFDPRPSHGTTPPPNVTSYSELANVASPMVTEPLPSCAHDASAQVEIAKYQDLPGFENLRQLAPLIEELNFIQQLKWEKMQEAMVTALQTLGRMHFDQMNALQDEIREIRKINQELLDLKKNDAADASAATRENPRKSPLPRPNPKELSRRPLISPQTDANMGPEGSSPTDQAEPAGLRNEANAETPVPNAAVHAWLFEKLDEIQEERKSSWSRLMRGMRW